MKINKQKVEKFLAFTLAEVLITMIIITLMTLASIPVIKKSKEYRASAKDKNTWMAMYDKDDKLRVYVDGDEDTSGKYIGTENGQEYAKFVPPKGVTRFNVTVVGGGGGGASGIAGTGEVQTFTYRDDYFVQPFIPKTDGIYQILAIGGGGGGGGGGAMCEGGGGWSGGAIVQQAKLKQGKIYAVLVGRHGGEGKAQTIGNFLGDVFLPVTIIASAAGFIVTGGLGLAAGALATWLTYGTAGTVMALRDGWVPTDRMQGGGNGGPSQFMNEEEGVNIIAAGGGGGDHRRKKGFWPKCRSTGGCDGENANGNCTNMPGVLTEDYTTHSVGANLVGGPIVQINSQAPGEGRERKEGYICKSATDCKQNIQKYFGNEGFLYPGGNGGTGGARHRTGYNGTDGIVQVQELPVYGGGAGSPGAISFYSYTKSPLENGSSNNCSFNEAGDCVRVYPGKGGKGGTKAGEDGQDGVFSRFGTRIIADGGKGGMARATTPASEDNVDEIKAPGEDGIQSAIPQNLVEKIKYPDGVTPLEKVLGGLAKEHKGSCATSQAGSGQYYSKKLDGYGMGSCENKFYGTPGSGGAGGGAQGSRSFNTGSLGWGLGGNGTNGIVIVTW